MKPIKIYTPVINMFGLGGMAVFPFILINSRYKDPENRWIKRKEQELIRHETTHFYQQLEMLVIPFYVWYFVELFFRLLTTFNYRKAYKGLLHEREAYSEERNVHHNENRKFFHWLRSKYEIKLD